MDIGKQTAHARLVEGDDRHHAAPAPLVRPGHPGDAPTPAHPTVTYHCPVYPAGHVVSLHRHLRAQLLYAVSGIMNVVTGAGTWTVPPQQAVWIPPEVGHEVRMPCEVSMRSLYIHPDSVQGLPDRCRVVQVTPLLRELIARLVTPAERTADQVARLMAVLVDEVMSLESPPLHLPAPRDARVRVITDALVEDPADTRGLDEWATVAGASERTLARLFVKETAMGFREWRQQLRLHTANERLAAGDDVTSVSLDLGYRSPSAFIAMFKRVLGETPGRYVRGAQGP
jgi:AraC-like DNA-binding protein/mannose-6-phosphate isomerase-like protein (cupin superfamily)